MHIKDIRNFDKDEILKMIGLESRRSAAEYVMPALGLFGAGLIVGAGLGLLFAPKSGREIRGEITERVQEIRERSVPPAERKEIDV